MWSAEKRTEGLEYMHPKPRSHSGRIVGYPEVNCGAPGLRGGLRVLERVLLHVSGTFVLIF